MWMSLHFAFLFSGIDKSPSVATELIPYGQTLCLPK